jgi:isopentenyl diphosphate isomerase/L-lactate dehydrogenase-like FMN-dependent dehydrogenase
MIIANVDDYRKQCEARLPRFLYDYISGGSFQENTLRANIAELQATLLRQRVMVDESRLNLSIQLWDQAMSLPVVLGPVGMAGMYSSRGEVKAAKAAKAIGVPFTLSTMVDPEDAKRAIQTGIDGIVVSNHGGRQLDSVTSTIRALPKVVDAVQGGVPVFMDGGIRSGLDVLKALALGAKAYFVGRAWAYALGAEGESGVRNMLDILKEELRVGMILTGCTDVNRATPDLLLKD